MTNVLLTTTNNPRERTNSSSSVKPAPPLTTKFVLHINLSIADTGTYTRRRSVPPTMSSTPSPAVLWQLLFAVAVAAALPADGSGDGTTHLHLYIHQTATAITVAGGGSNDACPSFGSVRASDDELREGPDAASQYLGRAEGVQVQADLGSPAAWCTVVSLVFTEGDYGGSTLLVSGRADGKADVVERGVVGGTGKFRWANGYSLMTMYGNPKPGTVVFEMDLYVKMAAVP
jgi:hypothetical protein